MEDAIRGWVSLICRAQRDATTRVHARNPYVIVETKAPDPPYTSLNIYSNAKTFSAFHQAFPAWTAPCTWKTIHPILQFFSSVFLIHPLIGWKFILTNFPVSIQLRDVNFKKVEKESVLFFSQNLPRIV